MLKYSAQILSEKPDPVTGYARKRIRFPELNCSHIATVANHDTKEKMVKWALLRAIDSLILDRRIVSLGRTEEDTTESDAVMELDWTCKLKILVSNWLTENYPSHSFKQIAEDLQTQLGDLYDIDVLASVLSARKKASIYDVGQLLVIAGQFQIPISLEVAKLGTE